MELFHGNILALEVLRFLLDILEVGGPPTSGVLFVIHPSAPRCSCSLQTAGTRQTIYGHLALHALSLG
jgi:hypothetical protein